jgi:hypothetical protein
VYQKWSKEKIIEAIQSLHEQNMDISAGNSSRKFTPLFTAASSPRYFSSWGNAVKAAGIDYKKVLEVGKIHRRRRLTKWSQGRVLDANKGMAPQDILTVHRDNISLYSAARREFGSWGKAIGAAGYRLGKGAYKNSKKIFRLSEKEMKMDASAVTAEKIVQ